jgi:phosphatidylglycerophosphate synthase
MLYAVQYTVPVYGMLYLYHINLIVVILLYTADILISYMNILYVEEV